MKKINVHWQPRCPSCGSYEVDFEPFSDGQQWECQDCRMTFQSEGDDGYVLSP